MVFHAGVLKQKEFFMSKAKVTWTSGMQFVGVADSNHSIVLDSTADVGGSDTGARPYELFLIGLAGCTGMDVISILKKKKQEVTLFEVSVEAERSSDYPKVYKRIIVTYKVGGKNIDRAAVERAIELSETKYCASYATLSKAAEMSSNYEIVEL